MPANYDADNPNNWKEIFQGNFRAETVPGKQVPVYVPIPKVLLNLSINSPLIAIYSVSATYPDTKKYLGNVYQSVIGGGSFPTTTAAGRSKSLYSNETVFAEFPRFDDSYDLTLNVHWRTEQISILIFKYVGIIQLDTEEKLTQIENKIDRLL